MLNLDVISPEKVAYSDKIKQITVPGADGLLTILPKHTPLFVKLIEGELKIIPVNGKPFYMVIGGGFLEVKRDNVSILVTRAVHQEELDEKEILKAKKQAEEALKEAVSEEERLAATTLLRSHLMDLKVSRRRKPTHPANHA
jgi:F-type H+-transporting ATPase subunit epsilon